MKNHMIEGDPMQPQDSDLIAQIVTMPLNDAPGGDGWRMLTGSLRTNTWARVVMRYEILPMGATEEDAA